MILSICLFIAMWNNKFTEQGSFGFGIIALCELFTEIAIISGLTGIHCS